MKHAALVYSMLIAVCSGADARDLVMGNWLGNYTAPDGAVGKLSAKIFPWGEDLYECVLRVETGDETREFRVKEKVTREGDKTQLVGKLDLGADHGGQCDFRLSFAGADCTGTCKLGDAEIKIAMKRQEIKPPTLGAKPPAGAIVLFDGTSESLQKHWVDRKGEPAPWEVADGCMEVRKSDILTKQKIGDAQVHVEFMTPLMPKARGQGRGNSGVYLQGLYEVQVLDSFGQPPRDNEAGGIYRLAVPKVNAALPPGEWQTYDITFRAGKFDANGKLTEPPTITVVYNGETIHDGVKLTKTTQGGIGNDPAKPGGILLQNHGNPVRYRNIWMKPL